MSFAHIEQAKLRATPFGALKIWLWNQWTTVLAWYDIQAGEMPKSWRVR